MRVLAVAQVAQLAQAERQTVAGSTSAAGPAARTPLVISTCQSCRERRTRSRRRSCRVRERLARQVEAEPRDGPPSRSSCASTARSRPATRRRARRWKFLAAARTRLGPPMSISSISASNGVSGFGAAFTNGYRLTTTRSIRPMPCASAAARSSGLIAPREDAAVHQRVQRLHAAVHHLGKAGDVGDADDRRGRPAQRPRGAAGRHQLEAAGGEAARKVDEAGFVGNAEQGSWHEDQCISVRSYNRHFDMRMP